MAPPPKIPPPIRVDDDKRNPWVVFVAVVVAVAVLGSPQVRRKFRGL